MEHLALSILFTGVMLLGGLMCAGGWFFFNLGRTARALDKQIAEEGVTGEAEVTYQRVQSPSKKPSYYLTFAYTAPAATGDPETIATETLVSRADYERLRLGDKVPIRYLPKRPKEMVLQGGVHDEVEAVFVNMGIGLMAAGAALILLMLYVLARQPR